MASRPRRGLREIRTLSGRVQEGRLPHQIYLRVAVLAMEKARRGKERLSAALRVQDIDQRVVEIDRECERLLESVRPEDQPEYLKERHGTERQRQGVPFKY